MGAENKGHFHALDGSRSLSPHDEELLRSVTILEADLNNIRASRDSSGQCCYSEISTLLNDGNLQQGRTDGPQHQTSLPLKCTNNVHELVSETPTKCGNEESEFTIGRKSLKKMRLKQMLRRSLGKTSLSDHSDIPYLETVTPSNRRLNFGQKTPLYSSKASPDFCTQSMTAGKVRDPSSVASSQERLKCKRNITKSKLYHTQIAQVTHEEDTQQSNEFTNIPYAVQSLEPCDSTDSVNASEALDASFQFCTENEVPEVSHAQCDVTPDHRAQISYKTIGKARYAERTKYLWHQLLNSTPVSSFASPSQDSEEEC